MKKEVVLKLVKECKEYLSKYSIDLDKYDTIVTDEDDIATVQFVHKYTEAIIEVSEIYHTNGELLQFNTDLRINWDKLKSLNKTLTKEGLLQ